MAKRFRFKLEVVLDLRRRERDARRRAVADAVGAVTATKQRITELTDSLRATMQSGRERQSSPRLDVSDLRSQRFYTSWLHRMILETNEELVRRQGQLDRARQVLAKANARFKAIEQLKRRRWERHRREAQRREQAMFDEIAVQRFQRARCLLVESLQGEVAIP